MPDSFGLAFSAQARSMPMKCNTSRVPKVTASRASAAGLLFRDNQDENA